MSRRSVAARPAAILAALLASGGCRVLTAPAPVPAVVVQADAATMQRLKAALATAMGRAQVELGPGDLMKSSMISVLPRPLGPQEDRSLAMPTLFRLEVQGATCSLFREDTGARQALDGVACRPR